MKYLGIDYGTKRIGIATSDSEGKVAFPKTILNNTPSILEDIYDIVVEEEVEKIIVGESKDLNMKDNVIMDEIKTFSKELSIRTNREVDFHTELFTSAQAATENHYANTPREQKVWGEKKGQRVDAQAAALMLQSFLDTHKEDK